MEPGIGKKHFPTAGGRWIALKNRLQILGNGREHELYQDTTFIVFSAPLSMTCPLTMAILSIFQHYVLLGTVDQTHRLRGDSFLSTDHPNALAALDLYINLLPFDLKGLG